MCPDPELKWHPLGAQDDTQTIESHWPGLGLDLKKQKHALVSEFFYKKKSYPKAT